MLATRYKLVILSLFLVVIIALVLFFTHGANNALQPNTAHRLNPTQRSTNTLPQTNPTLTKEQIKAEVNGIKKQYPMIDYLPVKSTDFYADYAGPMFLKVKKLNSNLSLDDLKKEVHDWMQSHGVNPSTHKITYYDSSLHVLGSE